jgi:hypothetical protein
MTGLQIDSHLIYNLDDDEHREDLRLEQVRERKRDRDKETDRQKQEDKK